MWDWIKKLLPGNKNEVFTGAIFDEETKRPGPEGITINDIVAKVAAVTWGVLDITKLPDWPVFNQSNTSACVAFTKALMSSILYFQRTGVWLRLSAKWIYSKRTPKVEGMNGVDVFNLEATAGMVPEDMVPSEGLTEEQISSYTSQPWELEVGKALRMSDQRVILPAQDIETLASVQQVTGKPIMVWFRWWYDEWTQNVPKILRPGFPPNHHSVAFIPPRQPGQNSMGIYNGEKCIVIQDSWGIAHGTIRGMRIITKTFFEARNSYAAYSMRFKFDEGQGSKPIYDGTIISVQKILRYEGCFPTNIDYFENVGPATRKSLAQYQQKHGLPVTSQLDEKTLKKIRTDYSK